MQEIVSEIFNLVEEICYDFLSVQKLLVVWGFMVDFDFLEDLLDLFVFGEELWMYFKGKDVDICFGMDFGVFVIDLSFVDVFD